MRRPLKTAAFRTAASHLLGPRQGSGQARGTSVAREITRYVTDAPLLSVLSDKTEIAYLPLQGVTKVHREHLAVRRVARLHDGRRSRRDLGWRNWTTGPRLIH